MIRYLTGCTGGYLHDTFLPFEFSIGLLVQPRNGYCGLVNRFPLWGADNGCFCVKKPFNPILYRRLLSNEHLIKHRQYCQLFNAPDVLTVHEDGTVTGNAAATLAQYGDWSEEIRSRGFPSSLVAQDGLELMLDAVPWDDVDTLFLGGSTEWKLSDGARRCVDAAKERGKRTHMGRVNSYKRLALANSWGIDSADGTFLGFGPEKNLPRMIKWLEKLETK